VLGCSFLGNERHGQDDSPHPRLAREGPRSAHGHPRPPVVTRSFERLPHESLPERIDRFADYIRDHKAREPGRFPLSLFGYSLGGIVGWPWRELYNIDPESEFVPTLNRCHGTWSDRDGTRVWVPDREPWIAPPSVKLLAIAGIVPRCGDGDGLVTVDSATMGGRIPSIAITDRHANHRNVTGETDTIATIVRGFRRSDGVWPKVLEAFCDFVGGAASTTTAMPHEEFLMPIAH